MKLYGVSGHVVFLLTLGFEGCARSDSSLSDDKYLDHPGLRDLANSVCKLAGTEPLPGFRHGPCRNTDAA
jgi:hypothetical protein